jgi:hypothetical protein
MKVGFTGSHGYLGRSTASIQRSAPRARAFRFLMVFSPSKSCGQLKKPPPSLCAGGGLF